MNLIKKVAEYRKTMNTACGITTKNNYTRMYTDLRKGGVRSKYYNCEAMPIKQMKKFVLANPVLDLSNRSYSISLDDSNYDTKYYGPSVSLKFKLLN